MCSDYQDDREQPRTKHYSFPIAYNATRPLYHGFELFQKKVYFQKHSTDSYY